MGVTLSKIKEIGEEADMPAVALSRTGQMALKAVPKWDK